MIDCVYGVTIKPYCKYDAIIICKRCGKTLCHYHSIKHFHRLPNDYIRIVKK